MSYEYYFSTGHLPIIFQVTIKMSASVRVLVLLLSIQILDGLKLPKYFSQCSKSDPNISECIKHNANAGISTFMKGDKMYGIQSMLPLWVPYMHINIDDQLIVNIIDSVITDIEDAKIMNASFSLDKKQLGVTIFVPKASLYGDYDVEGKILRLPLEGQGKVNISVENVTFNYNFDYVLKNKKDKQYIDIINHNFNYQTEAAEIYFTNLFKGNKFLGETTNKFLNENWELSQELIAPALNEALSRLVTNVIQGLFFSVPYHDLFGK